MRLALKLTLAIWLGILSVLAVNAWTRFLRESRLFETDMARDHVVLGRGIAAAVATVWEDEGRERAVAVLERVNQKEVDIRIRFVELGANALDPFHPSAPEEVVGRVRGGLSESWIDRTLDGRLYTYVPFSLGDGRTGAIELSEPLTAERAYIRTSMVRLAIATGGMGIMAGLISMTIGLTMVGRPVRTLAERARRIGRGDFSPGPALTQRDELGFLGREMEAMARDLGRARDELEREIEVRLATEAQLRHAERVSTVGKLAAGVAHELGTPLNVIAWRTRNILAGKVDGEQARENARIAHEQCERITRIVRQLLDFARRKAPDTRDMDLHPLVLQSLALLEPVARKARVNVRVVGPPQSPFTVHVDGSQIQQVLTNLLLNAIQAMDQGGEVTVELDPVERPPPAHLATPVRRWIRIQVLDEGKGIPQDLLGRVFDPFFTTKGVGEGTGLGLSVAWGILAEHGGWIEADNRPEKGAVFRVFLPLEAT